MAKSAPAAVPVDKAGGEPLTLTEFCIRLSERDRRVALIGGFEFEEKNAGRSRDTEANYLARFEAFINKPV